MAALPPASASEVARLNELVASLQTQVEDMQRERPNRSARHATVESERPIRELSEAVTDFSTDGRRNKIKASDLPKFSGKDHEDVDQWIEKVTAIYEYSGIRDSDLLQQLPMVLQGNAQTWFVGLGKRRHRLHNWSDWQQAIRNAFYLPNHKANLRRQCLYRTLRANETLADYYQDKQRLQAYVFPSTTPEYELIEDMIEGIPLTMQPLIKASISSYTTLEEFRRILIDLEPGLRGKGRVTETRRPMHTPAERSDRYINPAPVARPTSNVSVNLQTKVTPPSACYNCGGNHWRRDCPHPMKVKDENRGSASSGSSRPFSHASSNQTPLGSHNKWKPQNKTSNAMTTRSADARPDTPRPSPEPPKQPETAAAQDKDDFKVPLLPATKSDPVDKPFMSYKGDQKITANKQSWQNKTPAFALGRMGHRRGFCHPVCIDSGSSISLIDKDFANMWFAEAKRNRDTSFVLRGIGSTPITEWILTDIYFYNWSAGHTLLQVKMFIGESMNTKVILGNDFLVDNKANIDLDGEWLTFKRKAGKIPLSCTVPEDLIEKPFARVKESFTIAPEHIANVPIQLEGNIETAYYLVEPNVKGYPELIGARSVGSTSASTHVAQFMNTSQQPITLTEGYPLGPVTCAREKGSSIVSRSCNTGKVVDSVQDEQAFQDAMQAFNINPELSPEERSIMEYVLFDNRHAFAYGDRKLGQTDWVKMTLDTGDALPISSPPYHASPNGRKAIEETIAELISDDVIETSDSPWASPAILVRQKGKDRFCVDYRKINAVLKSDQYPIPRVDDILSQFSGMSYYTTFDANKGFHQVEVDEKDREKTAFRTHAGLHQFKRMPFGLKTGPSVFQRLTDKILGRYKWQIALVYIDDIIIYSKNFQQHAKDVDTILQLVIKSGITLSPKKGYVAHHSIQALGHRVSNLGIGTLEETVRAVTEYPAPHNVKSLQRFLGLCAYYRKFVQNFARIATPLYLLLKKDTEWKWGVAQQKAMEELKQKLVTAPVLAHPDYEKPFIVTTDASTTGLGVVLGQHDAEGKEHPIVYLSPNTDSI